MAKSNRPSHVPKPVYPGGVAAMKKFVGTNLKYPPKALETKVEGTVTLRYSLDYRGVVTDVKVKKSLGHGCDKEAIRVVKLMRFSVPQDRKKKVRIHQDINIHFKLPKVKPKAKAKPKAPQPPQFTVNYVSSGTVKGKVVKGKVVKKKDAGNSYGYTINW